MQRILANIVARARRVTVNGREWYVAPATLIVPGVLNGSKGPLYYPSSEIAASVQAWNGKPLLVNHPFIDGVPTSANSPEVEAKQGIGRVYNARIGKGGKLQAEAWFDVEATRRVDARVLRALERGDPIELSTGLFTDDEPAQNGAAYNGRAYTHVARNYRSDHVAVLPDERGACSVADGCGIGVNAGSVRRYMADKQPASRNGKSRAATYDKSLMDRQADLQSQLAERFGQRTPFGGPSFSPYIVDLYDDSVVFDDGEGVWKLGYKTTADGCVLADEDPVEVRRVTHYEPIANFGTFDEAQHARDEGGQFTSGPDSNDGGAQAEGGAAPAPEQEAPKVPPYTSDIKTDASGKITQGPDYAVGKTLAEAGVLAAQMGDQALADLLQKSVGAPPDSTIRGTGAASAPSTSAPAAGGSPYQLQQQATAPAPTPQAAPPAQTATAPPGMPPPAGGSGASSVAAGLTDAQRSAANAIARASGLDPESVRTRMEQLTAPKTPEAAQAKVASYTTKVASAQGGVDRANAGLQKTAERVTKYQTKAQELGEQKTSLQAALDRGVSPTTGKPLTEAGRASLQARIDKLGLRQQKATERANYYATERTQYYNDRVEQAQHKLAGHQNTLAAYQAFAGIQPASIPGPSPNPDVLRGPPGTVPPPSNWSEYNRPTDADIAAAEQAMRTYGGISEADIARMRTLAAGGTDTPRVDSTATSAPAAGGSPYQLQQQATAPAPTPQAAPTAPAPQTAPAPAGGSGAGTAASPWTGGITVDANRMITSGPAYLIGQRLSSGTSRMALEQGDQALADLLLKNAGAPGGSTFNAASTRCEECGGAVDPKTGQCSQCGYQTEMVENARRKKIPIPDPDEDEFEMDDEDEELGELAEQELVETGHNPASFVKDEGKWEKAKAKAGKKGGTYNWALVTHIYKQMGGEIKRNAARSLEREGSTDMAYTQEQRKALVNHITANCDCWVGEEGTRTLNALSDERLAKIKANVDRIAGMEAVVKSVRENFNAADRTVEALPELVANAAQRNGSGDAGKPPSTEEWLAQIPAELREQFDEGRLAVNRERTSILKRLTANISDPARRQQQEQWLSGKGLKELRALTELLPPAANAQPTGTAPQGHFLGAAVPEPLVNWDAGAEETADADVLPLPTMNWDEDEDSRPRRRAAAR